MSGSGEITELTQVIKDFSNTLNRSLRAMEHSTAFVEQRNVLSNNAARQIGYMNDTYKAKAFARGCRGHIHSFEVFARNRSVTDSTITFGVRPSPEASEQFEMTVTVPGRARGLRGAWRSVDVGEDWHFWGMIIYVKSIVGSAQYAFDTALVSTEEPSPASDAWTSADSGDNWTGEDNRRYWFRTNMYFQSLGQIGVEGHVTIIEIAEFLRTAITNPDGIIVGEGLPYYLTTILGGEFFFNNLADGAVATKEYAAGDGFTEGWAAGYGFYPNSIRLRFSLQALIPRQPFYYENEQIEVNIATSGGTLIYNDTIGKDTNTRWAVLTTLGVDYYVFELTEEINHKKVLSTERIIVTLQNLCGFAIAETTIQITGVPVIEP